MLPRLASLLLPMTLVAACGDPGNGGDPTDARRTSDARPDGARAPDAPSPDVDASPDAAPDASPDASPDARPPSDAAPGCTPWLTDVDNQRPAGATLGATVHDGLLELSSTGDGQGTCGSAIEPCTAVKVYTSARLVGDFDAVLEVESVEGGTTFGGVDFFVTNGFAANTELIIAGTEHGANLQWRHGNTSWSAAASTTRATLRLHRVGNTLTATGTAGTVVLEQSAFVSGDQQLGIGLREGTSTAITGSIISLTVDGGGGAVTSDAFDCTANLLP